MKQKVIIKHGCNSPPEKEVATAIEKLGDGWRIVSANTDAAICAGSGEQKGLCQAIYVTTVVMQEE